MRQPARQSPASLQTLAERSERVTQAVDITLPAGIGEGDFKIAMRQVASSVAVITARSGMHANGLTATAVCSVSATPPVLLVCVNKGASAEAIIAESGSCAVNFLTEEQHRVARLFSTPKLSAEERFAEGLWQAQVTGAPVLEGALASFDCMVEDCVPSETHNIYLGRVVAAASLDQEGLIYRDGLFRRLAPVA